MTLHHRLGRLIDAFRPADGPPPATLLAFFRWCLSGAWGGLTLAGIASALGGVADVVAAVLLGWVVDAIATGDPGAFWGQNGLLVAAFVGFFLLLRPLIFGFSTATSSVIIGPNVRISDGGSGFTLTTPEALTEDMARIRARGFSFDDEERTRGMRCIAAPVFDLTGEAIAGVSVSGPTHRIGNEHVKTLGAVVAAAAAELSHAMGG